MFNYFGDDDKAGYCLFLDIQYFSKYSFYYDNMNLTTFPISIFKTQENSLYLFRFNLEVDECI